MAQGDNNETIMLPIRRKEIDMIEFVKLNHIYDSTNPDKNVSDVAKDLLDNNRTFIWSQYTEYTKKKIEEHSANNKYPTSEDDLDIYMILPYPGCVKVNPNNIKAELSIVQSNLQVNTDDYVAFFDEKIQNIIQDEGYEIAGDYEKQITKQRPNCTVIGWFKSSYNFGTGSKTNSSINAQSDSLYWQDISKCVIGMNISVSANGGNFTIKLPIIRRKNFRAGNWWQVEDPENLSSVSVGYNPDVVGYDYNYAKVNQDIPYLKDYFSWLISNNDLLLLSMEKLEMEVTTIWEESENGEALNVTFDSDIYYNRDDWHHLNLGVYDMIGLVDSVRVVTNEENASAYVEVTGRDLMKLLLDDGSFFFNISTASEGNKLFANYNDSVEGDMKGVDFLRGFTANPMRRLRRLGGEIDVFANAINKDIDFVIKGIISQLANIEVVPGDLFAPWGDERTKLTHLEPKKVDNNG